MPKVTCPLFSVGATGSISKLLTYRNSPRGYICRKWAKPTGLATALQNEVRETTRSLMIHWLIITEEYKASWEILAAERNIEPINAYLQENWERSKSGLTVCDFYPCDKGQKIYSGGNWFPNLETWTASFSGSGTLRVYDDQVFCDLDLLSLTADGEQACDGGFEFIGFSELESLEFDGVPMTLAPIIVNCPALYYVWINNAPFHNELIVDELTAITFLLIEVVPMEVTLNVSALILLEYLSIDYAQFDTIPSVSGLTNLKEFSCSMSILRVAPDFSNKANLTKIMAFGCDLQDVDCIFNDVAAGCPHDAGGIINVSGGTNAEATLASLAARTAITTPNGNWTITFN